MKINKTEMLKALAHRRATKPVPIDNASLYAGSPMYFYCRSCGYQTSVLPEGYLVPAPRLCAPCQVLKLLGWLD